MAIPRGKSALVLFTLLIVGVAAAITWAQGLQDGSLAGLTAEVRQLRVVIQEAGRSQTEMQALNVYLTAQQSRLTQVSSRLDAAHADLVAATVKSQETAKLVTQAQAELLKAETISERTHLQGMLAMFKRDADAAAEEEGKARVRESELLTQFRAEEARWLELIAKLEALVKR